MSLNATITFAKGATTKTFAAPPPGYQPGYDRAQAIGQTAAGADYVYDKAYGNYRLTLPLVLTSSQKDDLLSFFVTTCTGGVETFTFTDHHGTAHASTRFLNTSLAFTKTKGGRFAVTLELRVDAVVD